MKVLVTGGAGFIGSHITDKLIEKGAEVVVVDNLSTGQKRHINPKATFIEMDICSPELATIFSNHFDAVIHLAAQVDVASSVNDPGNDARTNILGSLNVLECCRKNSVRKVVYANSAAEIGEPSYLPVDEDHPSLPLSPYGLSKHTIKEYLMLYNKLYGLKYTVLRYSNVYGPRQNHLGEGGVVAVFTSKLLANESITIFGDGKQTRDFIYVEDAAEATLRALETGKNTCYNVGTGTETSVNDLLELLKGITETKLEPIYAPERSGDISRSVFAVTKIEKELGWRATTMLKEGLSRSIAYFRAEIKTRSIPPS